MTPDETPQRRLEDVIEPMPLSPIPPMISEKSTNVAYQLRRTLRFLTGATILLYAIMAAFLVWTLVQSRENTASLCALRRDAEVRVATNREFMVDHPNGVAGIPIAQLRLSAANSERTAKSLSNLKCSTSPLSKEATP